MQVGVLAVDAGRWGRAAAGEPGPLMFSQLTNSLPLLFAGLRRGAGAAPPALRLLHPGRQRRDVQRAHQHRHGGELILLTLSLSYSGCNPQSLYWAAGSLLLPRSPPLLSPISLLPPTPCMRACDSAQCRPCLSFLLTQPTHHLCVQVAMPDGGLITPVLKDADSTDIYTMSRNWADLVRLCFIF